MHAYTLVDGRLRHTWHAVAHKFAKWRCTAPRGSADSRTDAWLRCAGLDLVVSVGLARSVPNLPQLPGMDQFPGLQMHVHNYRHPEVFSGQTVLVVGASFSGVHGACTCPHPAVPQRGHVLAFARGACACTLK